LKPPLISIITIALNAEQYLEQTIQSVLNQTYKSIEYIIVDGGSTDRSLEIINKYKKHIDHFITEKDEGIADAMNKGIALASGDYILLIHADDYFHHNSSLEKACDFLEESVDILACNIQFGKELKEVEPRGFSFWFNFKGMPHQGILCRKSLMMSLSGFDTEFKICMDYDLLFRAYKCGAKLKKVPVVLTVMRDTGISSRQDWQSLKYRFDEERRVHEKNCESSSMRILYKLYWFLYLPYRKASYFVKQLTMSPIDG
jgi:glycosyltransferase involved in cell wall biosynthesis